MNKKILSPKIFGRKTKKRALVGATALAIGAGAWIAGPFDGPVPSSAVASGGAAAVSQSVMPRYNFADIVEAVSPAVVNIQVTSRQKPEMSLMHGVPGDMREFFNRHFEQGTPRQGKRGQGPSRVGAGSGFVIDADGHIVTNEHVIRDADNITVTFKDGTTADAELIGLDQKTDLALIKVDMDKPLNFVEFGDSDAVRVGEWVLTVGNPFGLGHSVNVGIVSARGRTIGAGPYDDFLQLDAPINRGNSGGPAFDMSGKVVGVNAAIFSPNGGNVGIGFAIPAALAEEVIQDLKADGVVERGWLGVNIQPVTDDIAQSLGRDNSWGAMVTDVRPDSPAAGAKIKVGDVILKVDGETIEQLIELPRVIAGIEPGAEAELTVWRNGEEKKLSVDIGRLPSENKRAEAIQELDAGEAKIGLALQPLEPETAKRMGLPEDLAGVLIVDVAPGSPAAKKGFRQGDVLVLTDGKKVSSPADVAAAIKDARQNGKKTILTLVKRGDGQRFIAIPLGAA